MALQPDGKVLLGGSAYNGTDYDFAIARYQGSPIDVPDTTPPAFSSPVTGVDGSNHKTISLNVQDIGSGLAAVKAVKATNCTLAVAGNTVGVGGTYAFTSHPTAPQAVVATKINQRLAASFTLQATDAAGNSATLDPVVVTLRIPNGETTVSRAMHVSAGEHFLSATNGSPGVRGLSALVNGRAERTRLSSGQQVYVDLGRFFHHGRNTVTLVANGSPGSTVQVMLGTAQPLERCQPLPGRPSAEMATGASRPLLPRGPAERSRRVPENREVIRRTHPADHLDLLDYALRVRAASPGSAKCWRRSDA